MMGFKGAKIFHPVHFLPYRSSRGHLCVKKLYLEWAATLVQHLGQTASETENVLITANKAIRSSL